MIGRRVLFVSSEIYPLAKTGGLADVCAALPRALASHGLDLRLMMPGYESALDRVLRPCVVDEFDDLPGLASARLVEGRLPDGGLPVWLLDCPELFRRPGGPYQDSQSVDWPDNPRRFAALCHAAQRVAVGATRQSWRADLVHCHDWQTALIPYLLRSTGSAPASIFTVHNLSFQGNFPGEIATTLGLPPDCLSPEQLEFYGQLSFIKAGLIHADQVSTVSPTYAREIQTPAFGSGLDGLLRQRAGTLHGILNGIDTELWNPRIDPLIPAHFGVEDLSGKRRCKAELQRELGLAPDPEAPLIISASRLTSQKMADIVLDVLPELLMRHARLQFALIGKGEPCLEQRLRRLVSAFPGRTAVHIGYEEAAAHRHHAGADILLHGSTFEPCGLAQLYAMRYGTIPIVSRVGGLADTVVDDSDSNLASGLTTGIVFDVPAATPMIEAVERALALYRQPLIWRRIQKQAMSADFSWKQSAGRYLSLYQSLVAERPIGEAATSHPELAAAEWRRLRALQRSRLQGPQGHKIADEENEHPDHKFQEFAHKL